MSDTVLEPVLFYERRFYCFSNFASFAVEWRDELWMTSEHAYQAAKFSSPHLKRIIQQARSAHDAKLIAHANEQYKREDWESIKITVMEEICRAKLQQHEFIRRRLLETGTREIIEDSHKDSFWGWGPDQKGQNMLGKIWMKLREELVLYQERA
ncbi:MAG: hypothetical protein ABA06_02410 [Parcubacteria bacterium C7867-001]|nr:MAG: hypothetical protein ABA06_02410 [Parcubacteria bacterium C7867-001]